MQPNRSKRSDGSGTMPRGHLFPGPFVAAPLLNSAAEAWSGIRRPSSVLTSELLRSIGLRGPPRPARTATRGSTRPTTTSRSRRDRLAQGTGQRVRDRRDPESWTQAEAARRGREPAFLVLKSGHLVCERELLRKRHTSAHRSCEGQVRCVKTISGPVPVPNEPSTPVHRSSRLPHPSGRSSRPFPSRRSRSLVSPELPEPVSRPAPGR